MPARAAATAVLLIFAGASSRGKDTNVVDFGASPGGSTLATAGIQNAIDQCAATGGGRVSVPSGVFLTRTIFLKSGVELHLQKGAVLLGDTDPQAFAKAVVEADRIENAAITGLGTIDGQGDVKHFPLSGPRHHDLLFFQCRNVTVADITLLNAPFWVLRIQECDGVKVHGVTVHSYVNQNNDGIDLEAKNVTISDCVIDSEDDGICLKSDNPAFIVENVAITNCVIGSDCNAIKFGTASRGGFRNIAISNCVVRWPQVAGKIPGRSTLKGCPFDAIAEAGLALEIVDGGFMDQINISHLTMTGIQTPIFIRLGNRAGAGTLKNVFISGITATDETMLNSSITGVPGSYVENVVIKDLLFNCKGTGTRVEADAPVVERVKSYPQTNLVFGYSVPAYGMYVRHVRNLRLENLVFNLRSPDARPAVALEDCHDVRLADFEAASPTGDQPLIRVSQSTNVAITGYQSVRPIAHLLRVEGASTSEIKLTGNDFSHVQEVVDYRNGAKASVVKLTNNFEESRESRPGL